MIAALAARQHGVVAFRQLRKLGIGRGAIQHRLDTGRLHPLYRGVYAVGHPVPTPYGRLIAAVFACGEQALLSHRSAADHWGILPSARGKVDVLIPGRSRCRIAGIDPHLIRRLHPDDRAECDGIPVTSVARTLLDLAGVVQPRRLERAFEEAERRRLLDVKAVLELCGRSSTQKGLGSLRALCEQAIRPDPVKSKLERRFLRLCREAGLPAPSVNAWVDGFEVDIAWPAQKLIVELDSWEFHRSRASFERDRARDEQLQLAGHRIIRVTDRRMKSDVAGLAATVRSLLSRS